MKKWIKSMMIAGVTVLAACSNTTTTTTTSSANQETAWQKIEKNGVLKVATPGTLFPTSYYNDAKELVGYEVDMVKEIGKRLNIGIEFVEIGVAEAFTSLDSGKVDVSVNNFSTTPERLEKYHFSESYKYSVSGMIVREDGSSGIEKADLSDWKGKKAGGGAGTSFMKIAQKLGAEPVIYDNVTNDVYLRDVSTGRTDFIPNDYFTQVMAVAWAKENFPDIKVKMGEAQYNPSEHGIVMLNKDTSLKEKLDGAIQDMKKDGTLKAISEKYYGGQDLSKPLENAKDLPVIDISDVK